MPLGKTHPIRSAVGLRINVEPLEKGEGLAYTVAVASDERRSVVCETVDEVQAAIAEFIGLWNAGNVERHDKATGAEIAAADPAEL